MQLLKSFTNYQRYCNFKKTLHSHLKIEIIRRINIVISRIELKKLTRLIEKTESVSKNLKTKIRSSRVEFKSRRYRSYFKLEDFVLSSDSASQFRILIESKNENEKIDASEMTEAEAKVDRDRFELIIKMIDCLKMKISRTINQT
jgi:hypothetical protein